MSPRPSRIDDVTAPAQPAGRTQPNLGPSDTSDSGSDMPPWSRDEASDSGGTGTRAGADVVAPEDAADIEADRLADSEGAGLATTAPDPERNGGLPPEPEHPVPEQPEPQHPVPPEPDEPLSPNQK